MPKFRAPQKAVRAAVIKRLKAATKYSVFSREPARALSKYIVVTNISLEHWGTKTQGGCDVNFQVECASKSTTGPEVAEQMLLEATEDLTNAILDLTDDSFTATDNVLDFSLVRQESSGEYRGVCSFQTFVADTA